MKKILTAIAFLSFVTFSSYAQKAGHAKDHGNKAQKHELKKELNLSKDQKQQVKEVKKSFKGQASQVKANNTLTREQKRSQLLALKQAKQSKMKTILTGDQQRKLAQWKQENRKKKHTHTTV